MISHVVGFDDAPFGRDHRGNVMVVGAMYAGRDLVGVLRGDVRRDGRNSTDVLAATIRRSQFAAHLQLIMLQGIAMAGFNVVDIARLSEETRCPVLVVARHGPNLTAIRRALLTRVPGGARKWRLIERAGPMEPMEGVYVQRAGICAAEARQTLRRFQRMGRIPDPLRTAHLIAGGITTGASRGRT